MKQFQSKKNYNRLNNNRQKNNRQNNSRTKNKYSNKSRLSSAQKTIFSVIVLAIIIIVVVVICIPFLKSENIVKTKIDSLADYYYEEYFYDNLVNSQNFSGNAEKTLEKYKDKGIAKVLLRQLISHNSKESQDIIKNIEGTCDKDKTYVIFYPEPPYEKSSYRKEFFYSCNF